MFPIVGPLSLFCVMREHLGLYKLKTRGDAVARATTPLLQLNERMRKLNLEKHVAWAKTRQVTTKQQLVLGHRSLRCPKYQTALAKKYVSTGSTAVQREITALIRLQCILLNVKKQITAHFLSA